jgi:hypothetical protein
MSGWIVGCGARVRVQVHWYTMSKQSGCAGNGTACQARTEGSGECVCVPDEGTIDARLPQLCTAPGAARVQVPATSQVEVVISHQSHVAVLMSHKSRNDVHE